MRAVIEEVARGIERSGNVIQERMIKWSEPRFSKLTIGHQSDEEDQENGRNWSTSFALHLGKDMVECESSQAGRHLLPCDAESDSENIESRVKPRGPGPLWQKSFVRCKSHVIACAVLMTCQNELQIQSFGTLLATSLSSSVVSCALPMTIPLASLKAPPCSV